MSEKLSAAQCSQLIRHAAYEELDELFLRFQDDSRKQVQSALQAAQKRKAKEDAERDRVRAMYALQRELGGNGLVVGVDEVGRGPLAGPLTVAAVVLPEEPLIWGINDSKQVTPAQREILAEQIAECAYAIGLAHIPSQEIDELGMGASLRKAMRAAIDDTGIEPDCVLIDGNPVHAHPKEKTLVKGDARIAAIAAASLVAKVMRDNLMVAYAQQYPEYHFDANKGYGSAEHIAAIRQYGLCPIHRVSFCGNFVDTPALF